MILGAEIVLPLLLMASQLSGLPVPPGAPLPVVEVGEEAEFDQGGRLGWRADQAVGVTNLRTGHIRLYAGWHPGDNDTCVLVHELTHYLQVGNHVDPGDIRAIEGQAWDATVACYMYRREFARANWAVHQRALYGPPTKMRAQ